MHVYKLLTETQWREVRALDAWDGAPIDRADGFVHLSATHQVLETARRHFAGQGPLVMLGYDPADLSLTWEASRGGDLFPHLYGPLPLDRFQTLHRIPETPDGHDFNGVITRSDRALDGVRVLDLSRILAGPTATQLLGDLGAEVIKVERPGEGDDTRRWGPPFLKDAQGQDTTESTYYQCANRNKRSIAVEQGTDAGSATLRALLASTDVLVENFKVGTLERWGLGPEDLLKTHPGLVICRITGFGQTGPNAHLPGYDLLAQGVGGIMALTGPVQGPPMKVGVAVCDVITGLYASTAILAALRHRDRTGQGQVIDLALVDVQLAWLANAATQALNTGVEPRRWGNEHPTIVPYQPFAVADGQVIVAVGNDAQYRNLCAVLQHPEWATDPRFATNPARLAHREVLVPLLAQALLPWHREPLLTAMAAAGIPGGPIHSVLEALHSPQSVARDMVVELPHGDGGVVKVVNNPIKLSATPIREHRPPPRLGEHTEEVLSAWKKG